MNSLAIHNCVAANGHLSGSKSQMSIPSLGCFNGLFIKPLLPCCEVCVLGNGIWNSLQRLVVSFKVFESWHKLCGLG